ncbi:MAG: ABC transporter permease, partial [Burkholderiaceae bacterium]
MGFKFVFLWTDLVLWLVVAGVVIYVWRARKNPRVRANWLHVAHSAPAMCAAIVLGVFITIALLDSVHFRPRLPPAEGAAADAPPAYATRTISIFDALVSHAIEAREKTYSTPLAYWSFQKETQVVDGQEVRGNPRLLHAGSHLKNPEGEWVGDVAARSIAGISFGLIAGLAIALAIAAWRGRHHGGWRESLSQILRGDTNLPWRAMLITVIAMTMFIGWIAALWPYYHPFGTDRTGNDVLYQALKSIRTAVVIGSLATIATLPLAIVLGILAGYFKGRVDDAIQYFYTVLSSIPPILLVAAFVLLVNVYIDQNADVFETGVERAEFRLFLLCLILGVTGWATLCRLLRAETLKIRELEYVQAAHAFGVSKWRVMKRHIFPNVMHLVLIVAVLDFSALVLYEA